LMAQLNCMRNILAILTILISVNCRAQDGKMVIRILDGVTGSAISGADISASYGKLLAHSDTAGYVVLPVTTFSSGNYIIITATGYRPDTVTAPSSAVYLQRPRVDLPEATISAANVKRLFNSETEYVVDYCFAGNNIHAATFSGSNGRNAKLVTLNSLGTETGRVSLPHEPTALFSSCVGNNYCVCTDGFYLLGADGDKTVLQKKYSNDLLHALQQCECAADGNLYYRVSDKVNFKTVYGMIAKGDSVFRPFKRFEEQKVAQASYMELQEIIALYEQGRFAEAARKQNLRRMWDNGSLSHITVPIFACHDTLVVFDYPARAIACFDLAGNQLAGIPINFEWKQSQQFEILKDDITDKLYIHRYDNKARQLVEELDLHTGKTTNRYAIKKPFAEKVKIHDGTIYYLWQDGAHQKTQQLYVQQMR